MKRACLVSIVLSVILGLACPLVSAELRAELIKLAPMLVFTPVLACCLRRLRLFLMGVSLVGYIFLAVLYCQRVMDLTTALILGFDLVVVTITLIQLSDGASRKELLTSISWVMAIMGLGCVTAMIFTVVFVPEHYVISFDCAHLFNGDRFPEVYSDCYETHAVALSRHTFRAILVASSVVLGLTLFLRQKLFGMIRSPFLFSGTCLWLFILIGVSLLPLFQMLAFGNCSPTDTRLQPVEMRHAYSLLTVYVLTPFPFFANFVTVYQVFRMQKHRMSRLSSKDECYVEAK